ncbi:MAG: DNA polymerase IV [Acidimicrobiales bacterium]
MAPVILHVDMDAFYAAVEVRDHPELSGRPVIVGGTGRRGVVASCSYEARAYGIHSAMPSGRARQLCPHAVFLAGRHDRYREASDDIARIFAAFTPLVEPIALDEAFLDVTGAERLLGTPPRIAAAIRARTLAELGLAASVGVAPNKLLAKLASEAAKPRASLQGVRPGPGVVVVAPGEELAFLHPHRVEALWGVGPATAGRLRRLGVTTVGDLAAVPVEILERSVGRVHGRHLHDLAWGRDERWVEATRPVKSISHEETYAVDRFEAGELHPELVRMADAVGRRMHRAGLVGRTITVKVRFADFTTVTRSHRLGAPVTTSSDIARSARLLLDGVEISRGVRLLGLGVSGLTPFGALAGAEQLVLGLDADTNGTALSVNAGGPARSLVERASVAVDEVRRRFGEAAVAPATLLGEGGVRVKQPGDTQWGPAAPRGRGAAAHPTSLR